MYVLAIRKSFGNNIILLTYLFTTVKVGKVMKNRISNLISSLLFHSHQLRAASYCLEYMENVPCITLQTSLKIMQFDHYINTWSYLVDYPSGGT